MNNSPTEGASESVASTELTTDHTQQTSAEQNQETNSREQAPQGDTSQGSVSDDTATQTQQKTEDTQKQTESTGGESTTDDGLAKFAKSQGFDLTDASDEVKRALKIAHDNQKAFRSQPKGPKITEATEQLGDGTLQAEVAQLKYERQADRFFSQEGIDRSVEPVMAEILLEKGKAFGTEYAYNLSRDLDTLYGMAQLKNGKVSQHVDPEQIRREERESINRQMSAGAPSAHATQGSAQPAPQITEDWIMTQYDSRDPEQRKLVDQYLSQK